MRLHLLLATALTVAGPAMASSIETVGGVTSAGSIVVKSCADCPAPKPMEKSHGYVVPTLRSGTQTVELKDINGEKRLVRTEAWMGGSPVVYISNPPKDEAAPPVAALSPAASPASASMISTQIQAVQAMAAAPIAPSRDGIDKTTTTSALEAPAAPVETAIAMKALDSSKFELRLQP